MKFLGRGKLKFLRWLLHPRTWVLALAVPFFLFLLLDSLFPLPQEKPWSKLVLAEDGSLLNAYLSPDEKWRMKTSLDEVPPELLQAIIAKEDKWFFHHFGVNPFAIVRAGVNNLVSGRRSSGASTLTMQLARMMEPRPRTIWSKIAEIFRSFQLEWHYSKPEILARYLSYLPYGGNVEGVKAASFLYFDRPPDKLSLSQSTLLTVIPNRPNSLRLDRHPEAAQQARDKWLRRFAKDEVFPAASVNQALEEPIESRRHAIKVQAPHFAQYIREKYPDEQVKTTLDTRIQQTAERILGNYIQKVRKKGVSNGSVLIIDNADASVKAWVGSADFYEAATFGQVDGIRAVRSPGSTLKPSLYALAFDLGLYTPQSRLLDVPTGFYGYSPENYDLLFRGPVSLEFALMHSLNIPAVRTLTKVGFQNYFQLLEKAGFETIRRQKDLLGLSLVLGGCGVTLEELTRLFSAFARQGKMMPLATTQSELEPGFRSETELFSPASAYLIAQMLSGIKRPDLPNQFLEATSRPKICWKTGTSYGRRDAWSIGFTPRYTIGVWCGNFDGSGASGLSGTSIAVPLLFELFNSLDRGREGRNFELPVDLYRQEICTETGMPATENCKHRGFDYYIKDVSPMQPCTQDQAIYINADSSLQYCTECLPQSGYLKSNFPIFPPELTLYYENTGSPYTKPPPHNPACTSLFHGPGPKLINPSNDYEYLIQEGSGTEIMLQAASDTRVNRHYWYVEGKFYRSCLPGEKIFYRPEKPGELKVSCMDDKGRNREVKVTVRFF